MDALCNMCIISETIVKSRHVSYHRCFSKNLFMFIRHMKKKNIEIPGPITSLSLH